MILAVRGAPFRHGLYYHKLKKPEKMKQGSLRLIAEYHQCAEGREHQECQHRSHDIPAMFVDGGCIFLVRVIMISTAAPILQAG